MVGYPESLTDPSYRSQILILTYPLVGNYGISSSNSSEEIIKSEDGKILPSNFESSKIWATGLIVGEQTEAYSHWSAEKSLSTWLKEQGIPGIEGLALHHYTHLSV